MTQYYAPITEHQERVEKFMKLAGQELPDRPTLPNEEVRLLRAKLILEEALETIEALGMSVCVTYKDGLTFGPTIEKHNICFIPNKTANLEEIIDGCCDISVVTIGTLSACGVPDQPFLEEVDENNLAKFGPGGNDFT
jgi:predicted HAD superfamily Cof-like phosphohydrolase